MRRYCLLKMKYCTNILQNMLSKWWAAATDKLQENLFSSHSFLEFWKTNSIWKYISLNCFISGMEKMVTANFVSLEVENSQIFVFKVANNLSNSRGKIKTMFPFLLLFPYHFYLMRVYFPFTAISMDVKHPLCMATCLVTQYLSSTMDWSKLVQVSKALELIRGFHQNYLFFVLLQCNYLVFHFQLLLIPFTIMWKHTEMRGGTCTLLPQNMVLFNLNLFAHLFDCSLLVEKTSSQKIVSWIELNLKQENLLELRPTINKTVLNAFTYRKTWTYHWLCSWYLCFWNLCSWGNTYGYNIDCQIKIAVTL